MLNGTVWKFNKERSGKNFGPTPWGNVMVKAALEDSQGNLIVGTLGAGVFWSDTAGHWQNISTNQGLSSPYVLSLCLDRSGNLWVGTDGGGLDRIKRKNFNMPGGIPPFVAQSVAEDADGGMWTAFNAHGAYYWKTNTVENFGPAQGLDLNTWTVLVDKKQTVWVGTRNQGFSQFETNRFIPAPGTEILGPKNFALFEDRNGQLWAGTQNGLAHFDGRSWKLFTVRDGLSGNSIRAIAQDTNGDFWIGTESSGLNFLANGKFTSIQKSENGLPCDDISCLFVDDGNNLWVGTFGHGLARLQNGKWTHFSTDNGLASDSISYIIEDSEGYLWLGSNAGLMRIRKKSLDDFAANPTNSIFCRVYGKTDGLPTCECSFGSEPAAISAHNGELFLPTTKGVVSVNPAALKPNLQPLTVSIEAVFVNGRRQNANFPNAASPRMITIPPGSEQLEIDYTALNFSAPELVRFKYRLEGHENLWTDAGSGRVARFPKLPPGNYRFRVIAENEDGIWNEMGAVLTIIVQPYWWQTMSFHVAVIILLLTLVAAVVRYLSTQKLHRQLQALKQREALEKERFRIAHDLHDQLGANLTQVALLGDMVGTDKNSPVDVASHAEQISQTARETTHALDEIVWAVNPSNDTLDGLITYACKYAQEYLAVAGVRYRAEVPAQLPAVTIPPEVRHNVFLAFKEAVNNVVKHAQASEVWVRLHLLPNRFILEIEDNGRGISSMDSTPGRNGLRNMKKRMEDLYGEFSIAGGAKGGTVVRLVAPLSRKTA
jgi:signal transduction histidine kinase